MEKYQIGSVIEGRYELKNKAGTGGMASVYLAFDRLTNTEVAVKIVDEKSLANPNALERFEIETESIAQLIDSKYVVKLHDVIKKDGNFLLILEYVDGGDLKKFMAMFAPLTLSEIKYYFGDLCKALEKVHEKKIVHRDIKPENVLLTLDKQVKLTDFGISLMEGYNKERTKQIGTPKYIAPEVLDGLEATARTDVYSLGIMMYEAATGFPPFRSAKAPKVATEHLHQKPIPPKELNPNIPQGLENIILKMIEKDPDLRFQSMREVRHALHAVNDFSGKAYQYKGKYKVTRDGHTQNRAAHNLNSRRPGVISSKAVSVSLITGLVLLLVFVGLMLWML